MIEAIPMEASPEAERAQRLLAVVADPVRWRLLSNWPERFPMLMRMG